MGEPGEAFGEAESQACASWRFPVGDRTLHFRFSSLTEYRRVLERDLLNGRLLVPYRAEPLELYDDLTVRIFAGDSTVDVAASVVAPKVARGRRTYVGLSVNLDPDQLKRLRRMAAQSSTSSPDSAGHLFKEDDSTDLEELRSTMEERLFGTGAPAASPDTGEHRTIPKAEWSEAVVPRFAPDAYFPHVQTSARPAVSSSITRWPQGLPKAATFERARDGALDSTERTAFLSDIDTFVRQAREVPAADLLGISEGADEDTVHHAFQRLTVVLGTRNPMQTLDLELARAIEIVFDILIRARDSALANIVRSGGSLRRAVADPIARRDSSAVLPAPEHRPGDTGNHRQAGEEAGANRTQIGSVLALVDEDSGPLPGQ